MTAAGYVLGHKHGGRKFLPSAHEKFANILLLPMATMLVLGVYLKLHIHERTVRPYAVVAHGVLGKTWPLLAWVQMLFGAVALGGYCGPEALSQCLAHYIMGSAFIGYGVLLLLALALGGWAAWIAERGVSQEWIDSWVIMLWGIVRRVLFLVVDLIPRRSIHLPCTAAGAGATRTCSMCTQPARGVLIALLTSPCSSLGVLWWAGGALGILLSSKGRRSVVPALLYVPMRVLSFSLMRAGS